MKGEEKLQSNINFNIHISTAHNSNFPRPVNENYDYWVPLLNYFLAKSDTIEVHCWNEETESIEEINSLHKEEIETVKKENLTIFKGKNKAALSDFLLYNTMNKNGEFKWFTVNLNKDLVSVFHSGHWATEFFVPNVTEKDIGFIKGIIPAETDFRQF